MKAEVLKMSENLSNKKKMEIEESILKNHTQAYLKDVKQIYTEDGGSKLIAR
jgi:hypothetical protein